MQSIDRPPPLLIPVGQTPPEPRTALHHVARRCHFRARAPGGPVTSHHTGRALPAVTLHCPLSPSPCRRESFCTAACPASPPHCDCECLPFLPACLPATAWRHAWRRHCSSRLDHPFVSPRPAQTPTHPGRPPAALRGANSEPCRAIRGATSGNCKHEQLQTCFIQGAVIRFRRKTSLSARRCPPPVHWSGVVQH